MNDELQQNAIIQMPQKQVLKPSAAEPFRLKAGLNIQNKYQLLNKIGQGSFGVIYQALDFEKQEICAVKFEKREEKSNGSLLAREISVLTELKGINGFPQISYYNKNHQHTYVMTNLLGPNLEQVLRKCGGKFTLMTVISIALQLIDRIEGKSTHQFMNLVFHSKNFIHRDIKPENFVIGREDISIIYMIDFGLSKYYRSRDGKHIEFTQKKGMIGTARYSSINALQGMEQSRRDDLEAICYLLLYLSKGELPWMNINAQNKQEKYEQILNLKMSYSISFLCKDLPKCFIQYFQHVKSLLFQQQPNYSHLRSLFENALSDLEKNQIFQAYDWELIEGLIKSDELILKDVNQENFQRVDTVPPIEEEGELNIIFQQSEQKSKKFLMRLHSKFDLPKKSNNLQIPQFKSHSNLSDSKNPSQATSKINNYQNSHLTPNFENPQLEKQEIKRRKDSKSQTVLLQDRKDSKKKRSSIDDLEIADDDDANLNFRNIQIGQITKKFI